MRGQVAVATTGGRVETVELVPSDPPPCREALDAVDAADALVLGPGSLFTSVLPHLLAPGMAKRSSRSAPAGAGAQYRGPAGRDRRFAPHTHLEELARLVPALRLDVVIADPAWCPIPDACGMREPGSGAAPAPVAVDGEPRHDPAALADAFRRVVPGLPAEERHAEKKLNMVPHQAEKETVCGCHDTDRERRVESTSDWKSLLSPRRNGGDPAVRGGLHLANGRVVVEAELDTASVARRLRSEIAEVFGHPSEIAMLAAGGLRRSARWLIRVDRGGESLARSPA